MAKPTISAVIPHVPATDYLNELLTRCINSLKGWDELYVYYNHGIGYGAAFNKCLEAATGDYIVCVSNDTALTAGDLTELCDPTAVTYSANAQWGCFFCLPRWVYEKVGGFDEGYGLAYYEDEDYLERLRRAGIPFKRVDSVKVDHIGGVTVKAITTESEAMAVGRQHYLEKYGQLP